MRWLVDVTSLGKSDRESLFVEAESWQKALQAARAQRGESAPMSGFSIELLDDGCRAVDPMARLRYEVRKAPDEGPRSVRPGAPSNAPPAPSGAPPAPAPASKKQPVAARTMMMGSGPGAVEAVAATPAPPPHVPASVPPSAARQPAAAAPASASIPASPARADVGVPSQIIFKREQDATDALPLTYREYVYLVPPGTSEAAAETLLLMQVDMVRSSLERVAPGKLVNLGVFDVSFQGKPPVPPLATLAWKDWRGAPVVTFPRRPKAASAPPPAQALAPVSVAPAPHPPAPHPPTPASVPPAVAAPARPASAPPQPAAAPVIAPTAVVNVAPTPASTRPPAPVPVAAAPVAAPAPVPAPAPAPVAAPAPAPLAAPAPAPAPVAAPAPAPAPVLPPPPAVPAPVFTAPAAPPPPRARVRGEDLIADLFEAMHDLHFVQDALEGGEFCLTLAMEKLPCQAGVVHLYEIDRREFVVASTRGPGSSKLLLKRHPENDPMLLAAMRKRRAVVVGDATDPLRADAARLDRYNVLGGAQSVLIAPVLLHGRFLGAIELLNPLDGQPFNESEGNALTYIAEQFAEFISSHGVVTDAERISQRRLPDA